MITLYLVSCSKQKRMVRSALAGDLYSSAIFKKSKKIAEDDNSPYMILSANYGAITPEEPISNYDLFLGELTNKEKKIWATKTASQIVDVIESSPVEVEKIVCLAGKMYVHPLMDIIRTLYPNIYLDCPLRGLGTGERLKKLNSMLEVAA